MRTTRAAGMSMAMLLAMLSGQVSADDGVQRHATIQIDQAWAGRTPPMAQVEQGSHGGEPLFPNQSAVYVTISNHGTEPEILLAAQSALATTIVLHDTTSQDGTTVVQVRATFTIPAGGRLEMRPGQAHLRLLGLKQALQQGDRVPLTLVLQQAGQVSFEVLVR